MNDFMERLKHIPPWGYAVIALGVLALAYFSKQSGSTQMISPVYPDNSGSAGSTGGADQSGLLDTLTGQIQTLQSQLQSQSVDQASALQDLQSQLVTQANDYQSKLTQQASDFQSQLSDQSSSILSGSQTLYGQLAAQIATQNSAFQDGLATLAQQITDSKTAQPPPPTSLPSSGTVYHGGVLTVKDNRFLRDIQQVSAPSKAQFQTLGTIATKAQTTFDSSKLTEKENRFIRDANAILASGKTLSTAQLQTYGTLVSKAGTVKAS
jgi:hypothetical protein